jgi:hypothetical protein
MESYIDDNDNNNWRKVSETVDNAGGSLGVQTKNFIAPAVEDQRTI